MTITLAQLRTYALQRCDMENSHFAASAELTAYVNNSIEELYDLIVSRYEDYYVESLQFTITSPNDGYTVPSGIYKIQGLEVQSGSDWLTVDRFNWEERNRGQQHLLLSTVYADIRYRWVGSSIKLVPADQAPGTYRLWYIPRFIDLVNDGDTLQADLEQWYDYIVVDCAIKMLAKEESDPSVFIAQKAALTNRIQNMASNRDAGQPETVTRIRNRFYDDEMWFWNR